MPARKSHLILDVTEETKMMSKSTYLFRAKYLCLGGTGFLWITLAEMSMVCGLLVLLTHLSV